MGKPYIVLGDKTSHGGTVIEGAPSSTINGKPIACVGHKVSCPIPGHGNNPIVVGDPDWTIDGKPAARQGDTSACGATLIAAQALAFDDDGAGSAASSASSRSEKASSHSPQLIKTALETKAAAISDASQITEIYTITLSAQNNSFGDTLPIIPKGSRTRDGRVLFLVKLKAHVIDSKSASVVGKNINIKSDNSADIVKIAGVTDKNGDVEIEIQTRSTGKVTLNGSDDKFKIAAFDLTISEAWYEDLFQITGYNVCDEIDFSGDLVDGSGLDTKHKKDFLFGARGIPMQGTGKGTDGNYIRLNQMNTTWHRNARGNPDVVADTTKVSFSATTTIQGAYAVLQEDHSMAVDPSVIPPHARVNVADVGTRYADDTGSAIRGAHIDNFLGSGQAVVDAWTERRITTKRVKFLGYQ